jgi:hypothetical protein
MTANLGPGGNHAAHSTTPPDGRATTRRPGLPPVFGRAGFLSEYAVSLDSDYLIVTRIGPVRRWLPKRLHELWILAGMVHPADRPL